MSKKSLKGFTLIEVMIVVAILGIISAIAVPSYVEYVKKGKRADAKVELLRLAQMQESYFVQNLSYAQDLTSTQATGGLNLGTTVMSEQDEYTMSVSTKVPSDCDGLSGGTPCTGYTLTAEATGSQSHDSECEDFTLTNTGAKGVSAVTGTTTADIAQIKKCWR